MVIGVDALSQNTSGSNNIAIGRSAGREIATASNNINLANTGTATDAGVVRIGTSGTHTALFVAGVTGVSPNLPAVPVLVDGNGQLGATTSSRRFKEDVADMGEASVAVLHLRPVTFRYQRPYADGSKPIDYGLIAEEVAEIYPDLVVRGADGKVETVQYQKLTPMLLNEVQKQYRHAAEQDHTVAVQAEEIRMLKERLATLESLVSKSQQH